MYNRVIVVAIAASLLLSACNNKPESDDGFDAVRKAFDEHNYAEAYNLLLPLAQEGNADAQLGLMLVTNPDLGLLPSEQALQAEKLMNTVWLRKFAYQGNEEALHGLSTEYYYGGMQSVIPKDLEVAECFEKAKTDNSIIKHCQHLEETKGYIHTPELLSICGACHPDPTRPRSKTTSLYK